MKTMYKFVIRNNRKFVNYVRYSWRYFTRNKIEGVKIVIRKDDVFIHIDHMYCVILNDLCFIKQRPNLYPHFEASKKALTWLATYRA